MAKTNTGIYIGRESNGVKTFTGIRYANCERFGFPVPVGPSSETFDATQPSPLCPQNPNHIEEYVCGRKGVDLPMQEDALFLNVSTPADAIPTGLTPATASSADTHTTAMQDNNPSDASYPQNSGSLLPVMVWIHGGAFKSGGASSHLGDTTRLTSEGQVVTVCLNYRLGFYGFVRDTDGNLGNLGLLDLIEGLRWVHENIKSFGGDPENVTIFGQSAGGAAVQYLLATECAGTFFQKAIIQSSCFGSLTGRQSMDAFQLELANAIPESATMDYILKVQAQSESTMPVSSNARYCAYAPRPGFAPLPAREDLPAAWSKAAGKVDLMIGYGARETSIYLAASPKVSKLLSFPLTRPIIEAILSKVSCDVFTQGAHDFATAYANAGGRVFFFEISWGVGTSPIGGCHCGELPLILETDVIPKDSYIYMGKSLPEIYTAAKGMRSIWSTFARDGVVTTFSLPGCITLHQVSAGEDNAPWPI